MTHEHALERLDDFACGELPDIERVRVQRHVEACAECQAEVREIQSLLAEAAALPRGIAPPRDLWAGIAARIEAPAQVTPISAARRWSPPRWLTMAAASIALVVTSSLVTLKLTEDQRLPAAPVAVGSEVRVGAPQTALVAFQPAEHDYQRAIDDLQRVLTARRGTLAPETVQTLETNLRIIDEAIRQSRAALEKDPNSRELTDMLSDAYGKKLNVLQQAVEL
ncbi:MAG TPA: zf-HC2 domain-containing protein [Longimicrobium sp.]